MVDPNEKLRETVEALKADAERISELARDAQDTLLDELRRKQAQLDIESLRAQIEIKKRDFETMIASAKARGDEVLVAELADTLSDLEGKLKNLADAHIKRKPWWKFW
jgi:hypothetical protein